MRKNGQGLTLNTIVIAALVVIVLIVLILIFTGNMGPFSKTVSSCTERGGTCVDETTGCGENQIQLTTAQCPDENQVCCITAP